MEIVVNTCSSEALNATHMQHLLVGSCECIFPHMCHLQHATHRAEDRLERNGADRPKPFRFGLSAGQVDFGIVSEVPARVRRGHEHCMFHDLGHETSVLSRVFTVGKTWTTFKPKGGLACGLA